MCGNKSKRINALSLIAQIPYVCLGQAHNHDFNCEIYVGQFKIMYIMWNNLKH